jgi:hypothetical protein
MGELRPTDWCDVCERVVAYGEVFHDSSWPGSHRQRSPVVRGGSSGCVQGGRRESRAS